MDETLLNCPLCGSEAELVRNGSGSYFVRCTNRQCAAKTRLYHENENGARASWNRRAERTCRNELSGFTDYAGRPVPDQFRCSACGGHSRTMFDVGFGDMASGAPKYCPSCGARVAAPDGGA